MSEPRRIDVTYAGGDTFTIAIGDHRLTVDQPVADGGDDTGPTPTELFVASLVSCMGFFAHRFLRRNGVDSSGLGLSATITTSDRPHRVAAISVSIDLPDVNDALIDPLKRVVQHCTVHNSVTDPPELNITLERSGRAVAI